MHARNKQDTVLKFFEEARTDAHLSAALAKVNSADEIAEVAKRHGYELSLSDIEAGWGGSPEALDDTAAEQVAGGVSDIDPLPTLRVGSSGWRNFWRGYSDGHGGGDYGNEGHYD